MIPKPAKGAERARLRAKRRGVATGEHDAKREVRGRDVCLSGMPLCRWPHLTPDERRTCLLSRREVAHLKGKGAGGNKDGSRNVVTNLIVVCQPVHQGPDGMHAGRKRIVPLFEDLGTRGPCVYFEKRDDLWLEVGRDEQDDRW